MFVYHECDGIMFERDADSLRINNVPTIFINDEILMELHPSPSHLIIIVQNLYCKLFAAAWIFPRENLSEYNNIK